MQQEGKHTPVYYFDRLLIPIIFQFTTSRHVYNSLFIVAQITEIRKSVVSGRNLWYNLNLVMFATARIVHKTPAVNVFDYVPISYKHVLLPIFIYIPTAVKWSIMRKIILVSRAYYFIHDTGYGHRYNTNVIYIEAR